MAKTMNDTRIEELLIWFNSCVDDTFISFQEIVRTPYSLVLRIQTDKTIYYLKQTPREFFIEAAIVDALKNTCGVTTVPKIIASNTELRCFITQSSGDETLRHFFNGALNREMLENGIKHYRAIQQSTISHTDYFLECGAADWRTPKIPELYKNLLSDSTFIAFLDLSPKDIDALQSRYDTLITLCKKLDDLNIPDTLNHADFQSNNIVINHESNQLGIIDWGEVYIGNPLLSRHYCLVSARYTYHMDQHGDDYASLEKMIFDVPDNHFNSARDTVNTLYPIMHTLAWRRLLQSTDYTLSDSRRDRVRTVLLSFIDTPNI